MSLLFINYYLNTGGWCEEGRLACERHTVAILTSIPHCNVT